MDKVIQNNIPERKINYYEAEHKPILEVNIFHNKLTPDIPSGIFGVMYKYNNHYTILNIMIQSFRAIHMVSESNKNEAR